MGFTIKMGGNAKNLPFNIIEPLQGRYQIPSDIGKYHQMLNIRYHIYIYIIYIRYHWPLNIRHQISSDKGNQSWLAV